MMKINLNVIIALIVAIVIGMFFWNIYLLNINKTLQKEKYELKENLHFLDAFNEVVKYDKVTARDSVRVLEEEIITLKAKIKQCKTNNLPAH